MILNRRPDKDIKTTISNYIWKLWTLEDENKQFNISWKIIDRGPLYNPITKRFWLCVRESYHIIYKNLTRPHLTNVPKYLTLVRITL